MLILFCLKWGKGGIYLKDFYEIKHLIIGKICVCENLGDEKGPITITYNEEFIFEKIHNNIAEEVISGDSFRRNRFNRNRYNISNKEQNMYDHIFNKKYVVEIVELDEYLKQINLLDLNLTINQIEQIKNGIIEKWVVIKIYNYVNFNLKKEKQLQK